LTSGSLPELPGLRIEVVAPPEQEEDLETADVLRRYANLIKSDFILVSGDLVSDISLHQMIRLHHANNSALTCLLSNTACTSISPGPKELQARKFYGL
jgi:NDP-sugar pyrophosphorylase family protein